MNWLRNLSKATFPHVLMLLIFITSNKKEIWNRIGNQHVRYSKTVGLKLKNLSPKSGSQARGKNELLTQQ